MLCLVADAFKRSIIYHLPFYGADCTSYGRVFQKIEAATGNERRPAVDRRYGGNAAAA